MKRVSLAVMPLFVMVGLTMAQGPRGGQRGMDTKERAEKMTERMVKEYGLDDSQKQQLLEVNLALAEKMGNRPAPGPRMHPGKKGKACQCGCDCKENGKEAKGEKVAEGEKEKKVTRADRSERKDRPDRRDRAERPQISKEDMEKHRQEMKEVREDYNSRLQQILTQEQYQAYSKKQAEREQQMKERMEKAKEARESRKKG
ncbi:MAG: DUF4890 domain-containing protein [Bacteroides sp.]|nr:DUF4890 domain-containing protein [Bacteroides sp.]